ncbi:DUF3888 domain-containing protein [Clostridium aminobutyricum]|uniref:DUF3888 domain-containing protein n=1 Tax=Clostridium aminobutyricum TaxID=33953 RepID=A0A939D7E5_CLOAM|nr:DUF3888 domain-containing protein [Clostridium aminobutyricum]MBN7772193.1 DUF3888 domain-containing protein [Clostridium aminobutyricum]
MKRRLIIIFMILLFCLYGFHSSENISASESTGMQDNYNMALVNTYLKSIQEASNSFYDEYLTINPRVDYYSVTVKKISSDQPTNPTILITFICEPFVGPHDTIGTDEITFSADYVGNVKLKEFNHIKSYSLPDNLKSLIKKPLPDDYE